MVLLLVRVRVLGRARRRLLLLLLLVRHEHRVQAPVPHGFAVGWLVGQGHTLKALACGAFHDESKAEEWKAEARKRRQ